MRAKQRAGQPSESQAEKPDIEDAAAIKTQDPAHDQPSQSEPGAAQTWQASEGEKEPHDPATPERTTAANLLAAKRKRKDQQ
jgi:hypothetical protein